MAEHSKPVRLARAALTAGIDGKWNTASRLVQRINDECGPDTLSYALIGWIDTMTDHATGGGPVGKVAIHGMEYETGKLQDDVPPRVAWAQRVIKARAEMDKAAFTAAIDDLHELADGHERGRYVGAVLEVTALSMNAFPRGYTRMGRS